MWKINYEVFAGEGAAMWYVKNMDYAGFRVTSTLQHLLQYIMSGKAEAAEGSSTLLCGLPSCEMQATSDCASCKTRGYCSKEHQHADWKAHKVVCKRLTKARKAAASAESGAAATADAATDVFQVTGEDRLGRFEAGRGAKELLSGWLRRTTARLSGSIAAYETADPNVP